MNAIIKFILFSLLSFFTLGSCGVLLNNSIHIENKLQMVIGLILGYLSLLLLKRIQINLVLILKGILKG